GVSVFAVVGFKEKPGLDAAARYVASGDYFWNSGIFVWKASAVLAELARQRPALHDAMRRATDAWDTPRREEVLRHEYDGCRRESIDFAVMEGARERLVGQAPYQWDDVGSWLALERLNPQDADGNTVLAEHCGLKTQRCLIVGEPGRPIATIGVRDLLIIQDGDCTLIADRSDEGTVRQLVEEL